jgi:hypothetical protein
MKPISNDKRELIIEACERGESAKAVAPSKKTLRPKEQIMALSNL